jgi:ABC-type Fe3+-citrate transport system substrate-binding protein
MEKMKIRDCIKIKNGEYEKETGRSKPSMEKMNKLKNDQNCQWER